MIEINVSGGRGGTRSKKECHRHVRVYVKEEFSLKEPYDGTRQLYELC